MIELGAAVCGSFIPFEKRRTAEDQARRVAGTDAGQFDVSTGDGMDAGVEATQDAVAQGAVGEPP